MPLDDALTLDRVADELYGLDPGEFVATRTARQKQARADGDRPLATEIGALRKPTTVGWVVNVLARRSADELGDLLDLGDALREAQQHLSGATLRTLSGARQRAVRALATRAGELAAELGRPLTDDALREIVSTLNAALSDPDVAETVRRGRMLGAAEYSGFGPAVLTPVTDTPPEPTPTDAATGNSQEPTPETDSDATTAAEQEESDAARREERLAAERELTDATAEADRAARVLADAEERVGARGDEVDALMREHDDLTRRLAEVVGALDTARAERDIAVAERDDAKDRHSTLRSRVVNATKRLDRW